jgi:hypothetical protein
MNEYFVFLANQFFVFFCKTVELLLKTFGKHQVYTIMPLSHMFCSCLNRSGSVHPERKRKLAAEVDWTAWGGSVAGFAQKT